VFPIATVCVLTAVVISKRHKTYSGFTSY